MVTGHDVAELQPVFGPGRAGSSRHRSGRGAGDDKTAPGQIDHRRFLLFRTRKRWKSCSHFYTRPPPRFASREGSSSFTTCSIALQLVYCGGTPLIHVMTRPATHTLLRRSRDCLRRDHPRSALDELAVVQCATHGRVLEPHAQMTAAAHRRGDERLDLDAEARRHPRSAGNFLLKDLAVGVERPFRRPPLSLICLR